MKYWQSPKLKKLQAVWYAKLREVGFVDVEKTVGNNQVLIQNASNAYRQAPKLIREIKAQYYTILTQYAEAEIFTSEVDAVIMLARAKGHNIKWICERLKTIGHARHRQSVRLIIRNYEHKWGVRVWSESQLNPPWSWKDWRKAHTK